MYPKSIQQMVLESHGILYRKSEQGFPILNVRDGLLDLSAVVDAPFGYGFELDTTQFTPLEEWTADSLAL
jgi:hypothetical protein